MSRGEKIFLLSLAILGIFWVAGAGQHTFSEDSVPSTGFVPMIFAVVFLVLVIALLFKSKYVRKIDPSEPPATGNPQEVRESRNKILQIMGGLIVAIGAFEFLGAGLTLLALLMYLFKVVERKSFRQSLGIAIPTVVTIHLLFKVWLGVPLPAGPWGV